MRSPLSITAVRLGGVDRAHRGREHLVASASCGRKVELNGGPSRSRNGDPRRATRRRARGVGELAERGQRAPPGARRGASSVRATSGSPGPRSRVPSPSRSTQVARSVDVAGLPASCEAAAPQPASASAASRARTTAGPRRGSSHSSRSPTTTGSRRGAGAHPRGRAQPERGQAQCDDEDLGRAGAERQRRVARGEPRDRGPSTSALAHGDADQRAGSDRPPAAAPASSAATSRRPRRRRAARATVAAALARGQRQRLDERVEADERRRGRRARAARRRARRGTAALRGRGAARALRRRAAARSAARPRASGSAPGVSRTASTGFDRRVGAQQRASGCT